MSVSEAARRVGMNENELRNINSIPPRMLIKAGSVLIVPRAGGGQDVTSHVADNGQLSLAPEIVTRRTVVRAGKRETVATLAHRYRLSPAQVGEWNQLAATAAFKPGQQVVLHLPVRAAGARTPVRVSARAGVRPVAARTAVKPAPRKAPVVAKKRR
jgi:membrane-bound lytic murein transglycosylase D